jgi:O-antigen ligase
MKTQENLYSCARNGIFGCTLASFFVFIACGNLFRFIETPLFPDSLIVSEIILYICSLASLPFLSLSPRTYLHLFCLSFAVALSCAYGAFLQEADVYAILYAVRLIAMILSSVSMAAVLQIVFSKVESCFRFLCCAYFVSLVLGLLIYLFFSVSEDLWAFLQGYHIFFRGDPHMGRFVSVYFDPNYYASIAGMPFLMSLYLFKTTGERKYQIFAFLLFLSVLLTWSRSGIFIMGLVAGFLFLRSTKIATVFSLTYRKALGVAAALASLIMMAIWNWEELVFFLNRTFHIQDDTSALSRLMTFHLGLSLLEQHPFFGIGYNFLYSYTREAIGINSIDSSLLALLVQFGCLPSFGLGIYLFSQTGRALSLYRKATPKLKSFLASFFFYGFSVVLFSSFFNNILLYPFWLLPFLVLVLFMFGLGQKKTGPEQAKKNHPLDKRVAEE